MLILTRKIGESLKIGDTITVTVTAIDDRGHQVKLGIDAPKDVPISRPESPAAVDRLATEVPPPPNPAPRRWQR